MRSIRSMQWWPGQRRRHLMAVIRANPSDVAAWVNLIDAVRRDGTLGTREEALVQSHDLQPAAHVVHAFAEEIGERGAAMLRECAQSPVHRLPLAIATIVKWKSTLQCAHTHDVSKGYFTDAEPSMPMEWDQIIYPLISGMDFSCVLDLACGHGRNTEFLRRLSREIHLVDINASCIEACRARFGDELDGTRFHYHLTDGDHIRMIPDNELSLVYTWDSMVHFDKLVVRDYVHDIARALKPGGSAFLHHSNYGAIAPDTDWASNPGTRSDMSAALMQEFASASALQVVHQEIHGRARGRGIDDLDCVSILRKP